MNGKTRPPDGPQPSHPHAKTNAPAGRIYVR